MRIIGQAYDAQGIHDARRRVFHYFKKAYRLHQMKYVSKASMQIITEANAYRLLFEVVWPLSRVWHLENIGTDEGRFAWLVELEEKFPPPEE